MTRRQIMAEEGANDKLIRALAERDPNQPPTLEQAAQEIRLFGVTKISAWEAGKDRHALCIRKQNAGYAVTHTHVTGYLEGYTTHTTGEYHNLEDAYSSLVD